MKRRHDGGEGLVHLDTGRCRRGQPGLGERLAGGGGGAGEHDRGLGAGDRGGDDAGARGEAVALADLLGCRWRPARRRRRCRRSCPRGGRGRSSRPSGTSAARRRRSRPPRRSWRSDGLRPASALGGGAGAHVLVVVEDGQAVAVLDRDDRARRSGRPSRPRRRAPATARRRRRRRRRVQPSRVAIRSAPMPCGTKPVVEGGHRVHRPGAAVGAHRRPGTSTRRRRPGSGPPSRSGPWRRPG